MALPVSAPPVAPPRPAGRGDHAAGARAGGPIGLFVASLRGGGAERTMAKLAASLAERGDEVDLVLARAEGPYLSEVSQLVRIVDLGAARVILSLPRLVRYLRRARPQALIAAEGHCNVVAVLAAAVARVGTRVVVTGRNVPDRGARTRGRLVSLLARQLYPRAHAVVAVSAGVADHVAAALGFPRERIRVIYNPVVTADLAARAAAPLHHPWFAAGAPPVVLAVGRLTAQKDYPTLIRAFRALRDQRPARLMILGEGPARPRLEALARELGLGSDIALPGFTDNPYPYMHHAGVFVLASAWEGLPGVLIEAMACGCPLIATDCPGGSREILEDGRWGRLVPVGDVAALARAMAEVLDDPPAPAPEAAFRRFTPAEVADRYRRVLQDLP